MKNETLKKDLTAIYYALELVFNTKTADKIIARLIKKLKKGNVI